MQAIRVVCANIIVAFYFVVISLSMQESALAAAQGTGDCSDDVRRCYNACYQVVRAAGVTDTDSGFKSSPYETSTCKQMCENQFDLTGDIKGRHAYCTGASPEIHTKGNCSDNVRRCHNACVQAVEFGGGKLNSGSYETNPCKLGCEVQYNPNNDNPGYHSQCSGGAAAEGPIRREGTNVRPQGKAPISASLSLQSGIQPGANGKNRIPISRSDSAHIVERLGLSPAIYLEVTFADGTQAGPHDYKKQWSENVIFDDISSDPEDIIEVVYWNVDDNNPQLGKYAAQLTSTGKGVGTAHLIVSFRNAPGVTARVQVEVVSGK